MEDDVLTWKETRVVQKHLEEIGLPLNPALTFKNVAIKPRFNELRSRSEVSDFSTQLAPDFSLNIPLLGANMKSVTDARFSAVIAGEGGMGCIPQDEPIQELLKMNEEIRRSSSAFIDSPLCVSPLKTLREAKKIMQSYGIWGLIVVNDEKKPIGMLSSRDWRYETNEDRKVGELMTKNLVMASYEINLENAGKLLKGYKIEKLPLVDKAGLLRGLITAHGLFYKIHHPRALRDEFGRFPIMGTVGVGHGFSKELLHAVQRFVDQGIKFLLVDAARGGSINMKEAVIGIKNEFPNLPIMAGNICTPEEAKLLCKWGVDILKVGQGPGFACRTREIGIGIPQLTAIAECAAITNMYGKKVVADGGMNLSGDFLKALIAGASACMSGRWFMSTYEAAAELHRDDDGAPYKIYKGSASFDAQLDRIASGSLGKMRRPEGQTKNIAVTGALKDKIADLLEAFKSEMTYVGARNLNEMRKFSVLRWQTEEGNFEGLKR